MAITVFHHPFTRAAQTVWMLEELGIEYTLEFADVNDGAQKPAELLRRNPMGKLPTLVDGEVVVTESAAIGLYLADRYSLGRLAPAFDDPRRGAYLRWSLYAPSVIEPGSMAHREGWQFRKAQAGWGDYPSMIDTIEYAIGEGPYILGDRFTMVDMIFGGTVAYMLRFNMLESRPSFVSYLGRLESRDAKLRADAVNARIVGERGLGRG